MLHRKSKSCSPLVRCDAAERVTGMREIKEQSGPFASVVGVGSVGMSMEVQICWSTIGKISVEISVVFPTDCKMLGNIRGRSRFWVHTFSSMLRIREDTAIQMWMKLLEFAGYPWWRGQFYRQQAT